MRADNDNTTIDIEYVSIKGEKYPIGQVLDFAEAALELLETDPTLLHDFRSEVVNEWQTWGVENPKILDHPWGRRRHLRPVVSALLPFFFNGAGATIDHSRRVWIRKEAFNEIRCLETHRAMFKLAFGSFE